jgi:hypothetical protein
VIDEDRDAERYDAARGGPVRSSPGRPGAGGESRFAGHGQGRSGGPGPVFRLLSFTAQ